jgi:hypothetical protein
VLKDACPEVDALELGDRAAQCLWDSMFGMLYTKVEDRAWMVVVQCFKAMWDPKTASVPEGWYPQLVDNDRWIYGNGFEP